MHQFFQFREAANNSSRIAERCGEQYQLARVEVQPERAEEAMKRSVQHNIKTCYRAEKHSIVFFGRAENGKYSGERVNAQKALEVIVTAFQCGLFNPSSSV